MNGSGVEKGTGKGIFRAKQQFSSIPRLASAAVLVVAWQPLLGSDSWAGAGGSRGHSFSKDVAPPPAC